MSYYSSGALSGYRERRRRRQIKLLAGFAAVVALMLLISIPLTISYAKVQTVTLHVTGKESVNTGDGHEYRVYALEDTYIIADSFVHPRFDSANFYGRLPVTAGGPGDPSHPKVLTCKVFGWRVGLFSMFKNIKSCDGV